VKGDGRGVVGKSDIGNLIRTKRGAQQLRVRSVAYHRADGRLIRIIDVRVESEPNQVFEGHRQIGGLGRDLKQEHVSAGTAPARIRCVALGGGYVIIGALHLLRILEIGDREQLRWTKQIPTVHTAINSLVRAMTNGSGSKSGDGIKHQNKDHKN
jgi:hypothetical protein